MLGYGFGLYHDRRIEAIGVWFGFGQMQITRWSVALCLFKYTIPGSPERWNRYWFTLGAP